MTQEADRTKNKLQAFGRRAARTAGVIIIVVALLGGTGLVYQSVSEANDEQRYSPTGQMVDVGGYRLHLYCTG